MSTSSVSFPNPHTYLNHLSPKEAIEYEMSRNTTLILLGATIWDILVYIPADIRVIKRSRLRFVIFCFIFSRLCAAAFVLTHVNRRTMPVNNVYAVTLTGGVLCALSVGCSSYLFLQRLRAVYADSPRVRQFFFIFWCIYILSETITITVGINPTYIPGTQYFKDSGIHPMTAIGIIAAVFYDTSVFMAISYKIAFAHTIVDSKVGWAAFISGKALPRLSRAVLHGGQQYYLLNVLVLISVALLIYFPSIPQIHKSTFGVFMAPLMASMSCRVYREIKLFEYDVYPPYPISEIRFT